MHVYSYCLLRWYGCTIEIKAKGGIPTIPNYVGCQGCLHIGLGLWERSQRKDISSSLFERATATWLRNGTIQRNGSTAKACDAFNVLNCSRCFQPVLSFVFDPRSTGNELPRNGRRSLRNLLLLLLLLLFDPVTVNAHAYTLTYRPKFHCAQLPLFSANLAIIVRNITSRNKQRCVVVVAKFELKVRR